jgi:flagellar L-ring protein FlgH
MEKLKMKKPCLSPSKNLPVNPGRRCSQRGTQTLLVLATAALLLQCPASQADSLWKDGSSINMASDKRAHAVGDIITVIIEESNGATRQNSTSTSKKNSINNTIANLLYGPGASGLLTKSGAYPSVNLSGATTFDGTGSINNVETITAKMAVRVIDVLPNGNMVVEGQLRTAFSGEKQDAVVRGTIRPVDISSGNTILSYNIADATIQFMSKGTVTDATRKGWFTKVWDKINPF